MPGDISPVAQKMHWANHLLILLDKAVAEYLSREPYITAIEDKPELESYQVTAWLRELPPPEIAGLTGDFLNNAQGTLDYLAWQLVLREGQTPGDHTYFPIYMSRKDGTHPVAQILNADRKPALQDAASLDILDAAQPYHSGAKAEDDPLYLLKELNRQTKHRHPPLLVADVNAMEIAGGYTQFPQKIAIFGPQRVKDEKEIQVLPYDAPPNPPMPKHYKLHPRLEVELSPYGRRVGLLEVLLGIHDHLVAWVLPPFEAIF